MNNTFYLSQSDKPSKKYMVKFLNPKTGRLKTIHFGAAGMIDYTIWHKDEKHKNRYLERHSRFHEDWNNPYTAGFWSRWLLWNKKTIADSIRDINDRFNIKVS
jgi:hypothetical protein